MAQNIDEGTIGERAYRRIRADILQGRLAPAEKLKLERLKEDYGVSVSTLREVLSRLSSEKLVVAEGQRGFEVAPVSAEELKDIASLRLLLEVHAIAQSFQSGDMEWEARVVAAHHKLAAMEDKKKTEGSPDVETWKRYDWEFHQALISACGSRELMETHGAVFDKYLRYQMLALTDRGEIATREHRQLMELALKRDAAKAGDVLRAHITGGVAHALAVGRIV
ncbi:MAG: FCD domain-containing protein [Pseudolabrys sp.]|nr:FCD domain-containing protein [Pseudolabrys sp.]